MIRSCNGNGNGGVTVTQRSRYKNERITVREWCKRYSTKKWFLEYLQAKLALKYPQISQKSPKLIQNIPKHTKLPHEALIGVFFYILREEFCHFHRIWSLFLYKHTDTKPTRRFVQWFKQRNGKYKHIS